MTKSHHDKIAVVSGRANGIGQAFAQRLAQDGAHIVIADIAPGSNTVKMVEQAGRHAFACKCDVSSEDSVKALADEVTKRFGCCDILINCAGIFPNQPFDQMTFADWRRVQAINLDSVFLMSAARDSRTAHRPGRFSAECEPAEKDCSRSTLPTRCATLSKRSYQGWSLFRDKQIAGCTLLTQ